MKEHIAALVTLGLQTIGSIMGPALNGGAVGPRKTCGRRQMEDSMRFVAIIVAAVVLLSGCATVGRRIDPTAVQQLQIGQTTREQAVALLGTPDSSTRIGTGGTMLDLLIRTGQHQGIVVHSRGGGVCRWDQRAEPESDAHVRRRRHLEGLCEFGQRDGCRNGPECGAEGGAGRCEGGEAGTITPVGCAAPSAHRVQARERPISGRIEMLAGSMLASLKRLCAI